MKTHFYSRYQLQLPWSSIWYHTSHALKWDSSGKMYQNSGCIFSGFPNLTFVIFFFFLICLQLPNVWKDIFIKDINCICHALQFDTIQAILWSVIQYDLVFLLGLLWPWPLTYICIFLLAYRARYVAFIFCNHYL